MKSLSSLIPALLFCAAPAFAGVTVNSPSTGAELNSPFQLVASSTVCSSQAVASMGYSFDSSSSTTIVKATAVNAQITATPGSHILHVKSWGKGTACVQDIAITVTAPPSDHVAAAGAIDITEPASGAEVQSPFTVAANSVSCSGKQVVTMGYSVDSSTSNTVVKGETLSAQVTAAAGAHVLHVKSWSPSGGACVTDVNVTVTAPQVTTSVIPADAIAVSSVQSLTNWQGQHDAATGATSSSSGTMSVVNSPSMSGFSRQFNISYVNNGGERFSDSFGEDTASTNFFYDGWVYLKSPVTSIANVEMDMNQVIANGNTIIYAFQCSGWSGTWDYSANAGTVSNPVVQWIQAKGTSCNPRNWTANTWHHVQVWYSHDDSGNVTYHSVWFDGVEQAINATVPGEFALGWGPVLVTNFQIDGVGASGSATAYLDNLTIYRW